MIVGVDEAGRGPLAGPVVAAAVSLGRTPIIGLDDSKKLSAKRRAILEEQIIATCSWSIAEVCIADIDQINILQATMLAMQRAVSSLWARTGTWPEQVLVDGNRLPRWDFAAQAVVGGDAIHPCISAASILAKEHRDRLMIAADAAYPGYGFAQHKGYGTAAHLDALRRLGPCALHRTSFAPVRQMLLAHT